MFCLSPIREAREIFADRFCNYILTETTHPDMQPKLRYALLLSVKKPLREVVRKPIVFMFKRPCPTIHTHTHTARCGQSAWGLWRSLVSPAHLHKSIGPTFRLKQAYVIDTINKNKPRLHLHKKSVAKHWKNNVDRRIPPTKRRRCFWVVHAA